MAGYAQLLEPASQRVGMHIEDPSGAFRTVDDPAGLIQHRQEVSAPQRQPGSGMRAASEEPVRRSRVTPRADLRVAGHLEAPADRQEAPWSAAPNRRREPLREETPVSATTAHHVGMARHQTQQRCQAPQDAVQSFRSLSRPRRIRDRHAVPVPAGQCDRLHVRPRRVLPRQPARQVSGGKARQYRENHRVRESCDANLIAGCRPLQLGATGRRSV